MDEYLAHVVDHKCPSGQCKAFMKYYVIQKIVLAVWLVPATVLLMPS